MTSGLEPIPITSQKHDPAWKHCQMFKNGDRVLLKCIYCGKIFKGGGIHRIKEHLAGQTGNASTCLRVLPDVQLLMQESLNGVVAKKRKKQKIAEEITSINRIPNEIDGFYDRGLQVLTNPPEPDSSLVANREEGTAKKIVGRKKKGKAVKNSSPSATPEDIHPNSIVLSSKRPNNQVCMAIGRFFYDVGVPLDAVNSVYFRPMIDAIASQGSVAVTPSYHDLRGWILKNTVEEVKNDTDQYMGIWGRTGCSLLAEEWNSGKGRTLLNFWVYCPEGTMFLKSVDISDVKNLPDALYETLKEAVEQVGVRNVLQVITFGDERYLIAGTKLIDTFPSLYWAPCAAHCIDSMLEDFGKLEWINAVLEQARSMTTFVYNHSAVLNMMRRYTFGNDLVEVGLTCFATNFVSLKRMFALKQNLEGMVTSQEWMDCPFSKKPAGLMMLDSISNQSFWSSSHLVIRLTDPLLRLLRIVCSKKRPAMGYVYAGVYRAKETIKKEFVKKKEYSIYWNIIDFRWEQLRQLPLHAAGFYLNPRFLYSIEGDMHSDIVSGMFDCIERLVTDIKIQDKIIKEMNSYKNAVGDFGRKMAIRARDTLLPVEWWSTYGGGCPNLARLAVRILSQTCSLMGHKRSQVPFEQMYNTRNCLERQRLNDLVFVQYNLQLKQMVQKSRGEDSVDPISFDSVCFVEDWIAENNVCSEDCGSSDWMAIDPALENTLLLGALNDDAEELGAAGFDDHEIFNGVKDEENVEDNSVRQ
ncbi:uncharacterized protein LOC131165491 [Malania oleifera]|uniref:uncharacterized protein LOC131165491 n=1 Tax=Malania oleifera TaxID=397392 RepID=UPI0025AE884B|nr:uncharacterized protein LOC131165491 [Malania oleifera]